jgi:hypothetical protein
LQKNGYEPKTVLLSRHENIRYARIVKPNTNKVLPAKSTGESTRNLRTLLQPNGCIPKMCLSGKKEKEIHSLPWNSKTIERPDQDGQVGQSDDYKILEILKDCGLLDRSKSGESKDFITFLSQMYDYDNSSYNPKNGKC